MTITDANKEELKAFLPDYLTMTGRSLDKNFQCPNHYAHKNGDEKPSATYYADSQTVYCHMEGRAFDIFEIIGLDENITDFSEQYRRAAELAGKGGEVWKNRGKTAKKETETAEYTAFYRECSKALEQSQKALEYLNSRGITIETARRFGLGYCEKWKHPNTKTDRTTARIIIPRSAGAYLARSVDGAEPQKQVAGKQKTLFNGEKLDTASGLPFVIVEGEFDAMSIIQAGYDNVIGIGPIGNKDIIAQAIKEKAPRNGYILALDNDEPGRKAQQELYKDLANAGITAISADTSLFYSGKKDPNEAYKADPDALVEGLTALLQEIEEKTGRREAEKADRTGAGMIAAFLEKAKTDIYKPIKTGIADVDKILCGGFMKQSITILQAAPGAGKTALASLLFEGMAKNGHKVIFINLEMSKEQLIARSLARYTRRYTETPLTPIEILQGYKWTPAQESAVRRAGELYAAEVANNLTYNPEEANRNIDSIINTLEAEAAAAEAEGAPAPLVCIDYLQLIRGNDREEVTEATKRAIIELKAYAIRHNTFVLLISATNREANKSGANELTSGRDTSDIEYTADILLGLTYKAIAEGRKSLAEINREKRDAIERGEPLPEDARRLCLTVLKGRLIGDGRRATFEFNGAYSDFTPIETKPARTL